MPLQELFHTRTIIGQCFVTSQFVMRTQGHCYCFIVSIIQLKQFVHRDCVFVAKHGYIFAGQNKATLQQLTIATIFFIQLGFKRSGKASLFQLNVSLKKSLESERNRKDIFHTAHRYVGNEFIVLIIFAFSSFYFIIITAFALRDKFCIS